LKPDHFSDFIVCSCWSSYLAVRVGLRPTIGGSGRLLGRAADRPADELHQWTGVEDTGDAQRTPEGAAPLRQCETPGIGMQMSTTTRPSTGRIWYDTEDRLAGTPPWGLLLARRLRVLDRDNPQQLGGWCASPATHTRAHRRRATYHRGILPCSAPLRLVGFAG
jgi:hypothetical protein